jgi:hypothetical protein
MEMASYLAGERWSDHPACTHPLLAGMARLVNDTLSDRLRPQLIPLIPSVIGLTSDDLRVDAAIAVAAILERPARYRPQRIGHFLQRCILVGFGMFHRRRVFQRRRVQALHVDPPEDVMHDSPCGLSTVTPRP